MKELGGIERGRGGGFRCSSPPTTLLLPFTAIDPVVGYRLGGTRLIEMASRRDDGGGAGESGQGLLGEILGSLTLASTSASSDTASVSTADGGDGGDGFGVDGWFANPAGEGESAFNPFGGEGGNRNSFIPTTQTQTHRVQTMGSQGTGTGGRFAPTLRSTGSPFSPFLTPPRVQTSRARSRSPPPTTSIDTPSTRSMRGCPGTGDP